MYILLVVTVAGPNPNYQVSWTSKYILFFQKKTGWCPILTLLLICLVISQGKLSSIAQLLITIRTDENNAIIGWKSFFPTRLCGMLTHHLLQKMEENHEFPASVLPTPVISQHLWTHRNNTPSSESLRIQVRPKEGFTPRNLLWGWDWSPKSYSRNGLGFLGVFKTILHVQYKIQTVCVFHQNVAPSFHIHQFFPDFLTLMGFHYTFYRQIVI